MLAPLEFKMLNSKQRLGKLESKEGGISFERLTPFRDAFDDVVRLSEPYCPQLNQIKVGTKVWF